MLYFDNGNFGEFVRCTEHVIFHVQNGNSRWPCFRACQSRILVCVKQLAEKVFTQFSAFSRDYAACACVCNFSAVSQLC